MPELASILVGDHLGQVKKVLWPSGEVSLLPDFAEPNSANPVVSIQPLAVNGQNKHLIANKNGELYLYDAIRGKTKQCDIKGDESLVKALPVDEENIILLYEKRIVFDSSQAKDPIKIKRGTIIDGQIHNGQLAIVGKDIPLNVLDITSNRRTFEADRPGKDWLGIEQDCEVVALDFVGSHRVATCSKSDSVIRVYDTTTTTTTKKLKPIISVDINQTAFNEYAEAGRFMSVASSGGDQSRSLVVGSNVGQLLAIDLRFHATKVEAPRKRRLQPKSSKVLGGFKGARGATIKDIKIVPAPETGEVNNKKGDYKVISCCLDRYLRIHNFSKTSRHLDKQVYMKTKPLCCSPIYYDDYNDETNS